LDKKESQLIWNFSLACKIFLVVIGIADTDAAVVVLWLMLLLSFCD